MKAISDVLYLMIKRSLFLAAKRATLMEQSRRAGDHNEPYDDEVEKVSEVLSASWNFSSQLIQIL